VAFEFPGDPELSGLAEAVEPTSAASRLARVGVPVLPTSRFGARALAYRPLRRCVVRYDLLDREGSPSGWIGKCYRAGRDLVVHAVHERLQAAGIGELVPDRGFTVARPEAAVPDWNMLLSRASSGRPFIEMLTRPSAVDAARTIGLAIGALQTAPVEWPSNHDARDELRVLSRWSDVAGRAVRGLTPRLNRLREDLARIAPPTPSRRLVPAHRDLYDKQVLFGARDATLIDLDTACMAEPELDVANFVAHLALRRLQLRLRTARDEAVLRAALIDGYAERVAAPEPTKLGFYEVCSLARLSCVYAFRPRWPGLSEALIDRASAVLADASSGRRSIHAI